MYSLNAYELIITGSIIIIISYGFNILAKRTNIPSVLMLITLGLLLKGGINLLDLKQIQWFPILEILGIIGLIMIVLEAALELKLTRDKLPIIGKSFLIAFLSISVNIFVISQTFQLFYPEMSLLDALIYAVPVSIISSAIVIPSINNLDEKRKEFMVYESTFSDILGIMFFYFLLGVPTHDSAKSLSMGIFSNILITIVASVVLSYLLLFIFQRIKTQIKLFLLIAVLILLYAIGKEMHFSPLIMILFFGLILENRKIFIGKRLSKFFDKEASTEITNNLKIITFETSFVVRTFFFVIFGITIVLSNILNFKVWIVSLIVLGFIYFGRWAFLRILVGKNLFPELLLAPRGLITILLFYAIPPGHQTEGFNEGILLVIIIVTSVLMAYALIKDKKLKDSIQPEAETISQENIDLPEDNNLSSI